MIKSEHFKNFPKKNQAKIEKKYKNLCETYEGVLNLKSLPDALFIMGLKSESTAVREARLLNIPIISVCDTDTNPVVVDYLIPGNDDGIKSIVFFINLIVSAIKEGKEVQLEGSLSSNQTTEMKSNLESLDNKE